MKKILLFGLIIPAMCWALAAISCFDAPRDNLNDPKADNYSKGGLYMFSTAPQGDNSFKGRSGYLAVPGADELCTNTRASSYPELPSGNVHAFLSIESGDTIADMPTKFGVPTNKPIQSASEIAIANDWADLLDGTIDVTLSDAGISSIGWWSGATSSGGLHTYNCENWMGSANWGEVGYSGMTDSNWISANNIMCTDTTYVVLCLCWN
jgi:hypothetical protein